MGQEITTSRFSDADFAHHKARLQDELAQLVRWFDERRLAVGPPVAGFELEAWLVSRDFQPAAINESFLERLNSPLASPELASFNVEVNSTPRPLKEEALSAMQRELEDTWRRCREVANGLDSEILMIGILPTVANEHLCPANMSRMLRYRALNREVLVQRKGKPLDLSINGVEYLHVVHEDVMLESAATSFQLHLQVNQDNAVRLFNASVILSAPMVALSANSPFLFGKDLWAETRIPVFEQAVSTGGYDGAAFGPIRRVTFGSGYLHESLLEAFQENLDHYPILLPENFSDGLSRLPHLRLHNGTIWRWNRPLIGFDDSGEPHLRIEHRVVPAGPTAIDAVANAAFYYGAVYSLAGQAVAPELGLGFDKARDNFYRAAQRGLLTQAHWIGNRQLGMRELILDDLLPRARAGLEGLGLAAQDIQTYLGVIEERVRSGMNGAAWQRAYVAEHGRDMLALTAAYFDRQCSGAPVHTWTV